MSIKYLDYDGLEEVVEQIDAKYAKIASTLPSTTKYGASLSLSVNTSTYVVTAQLKDQDGNNLGTAQTIDLPLESAIVNASYDNATKDLTFTLQNGTTIVVPLDDIISGLQSEITISNKLSADLVNDATASNKFVKLITQPTNMWELDNGVYYGQGNYFKYTADDTIHPGVTEFFVVITSTTTDKVYQAISASSITHGVAKSSDGTMQILTLNGILRTSNVINNLTSISITNPLSANMGKALKDEIDTLPDTAITIAEIDALFT